MNRRAAVAALSVLALAVPVWAASWGSYGAAFPSNPCGDGWAGCVVGGVAMGPGLVADRGGRPMPAGTRIGWFDLEATASLSPFVGLSGYHGAVGGAPLAGATLPGVNPDAADALGSDRPPVVDAATALAAAAPAENVEVAPAPAPAPATGTSRVDPFADPPRGDSRATTPPPSGARTESTARTEPAARIEPAPRVEPAPRIEPAPRVEPAPASTARTTSGTSAPAPAVAETPPPATGTAAPPDPDPVAAAATGTARPPAGNCDDVASLEPLALMGQLDGNTVKCAESRVTGGGSQTTRDKYSRVLIANAEAKGDKTEWERLIRRHLEDIDRSDPDLCYKYALHLSRGGTSRASGVIRWSDYALENKHRWQGESYRRRVYALLKLRAVAAGKLWDAAETEYTTGAHTEENEAVAVRRRGQARDYAKEWLDYARSSSQDPGAALALCVSAAGNRQFCDGG